MTFNFKESLSASLATAKIILIMVIPYFLLAEVLLYFELMPYIAYVFKPFAQILNLPESASIAIAGGILFNLYVAIAFAAPLNLNVYDWTIMGLFLGVLHSVPIEAAIIKKLGINLRYSIIFRVIMAFVVLIPIIVIPAELLFADPSLVKKNLYQPNLITTTSFLSFMFNKTIEAIILAIEIIVLVTIAIFISIYVKNLVILKKFSHNLSFIIAMIIGILTGITYGAGVLLKQADSMSRKQIIATCFFLMTAHAIIEDTLIFAFFGANIVLLLSIRLSFALLVFFIIIKYYDKYSNKA